MTRYPLVLVLLVACANTAPVEGRTCPCAEGYTCCATDVCVPAGAACSVVEPPQIDLSSLPCTSDDDRNIDGTIDEHWVYHYDDLGNDIRDDGDVGVDGTIDDTYTWAYDDARQLISANEVLDGSNTYHEEWTYDDLERKLTDVIAGDAAGNPPISIAWTYDGMTATETQDYDGDGVIDIIEVFQQNAAGKPISSTATQADGTPLWTQAWTYDAAGSVILRVRTATVGSTGSTSTYTRDAAERVLHRTLVYGDGTTVFDLQYTYDDNGRMTTLTSPVGFGYALKSVYNYCQ